MNSGDINIKVKKIISKEDELNKNAQNLFSILINENLFNDKKTKIIKKNDYEFIIRIFKDADENEFINCFNYFNRINIPILKLLIVGFIEFDIENEINENLILNIISKGITIDFNKDLFYFIYKKLSKKYRKPHLLKDFQSIKKFEKLFNIWKLLYNVKNPFSNNNNLNYSSDFLFFPKLKEKSKFIEIDINDNNEMENLIIGINFKSSPILYINKIIEKLIFVKLYNEKEEKYEFKYNQLNLGSNDNIIPFSKICKIKFDFSKNGYDIYINKKINVSKKDSIEYNFNSIKKIEILNYFYGEVSSITFKKKYTCITKYAESFPGIQPLKMKIFKENLNNKIKIKTNAFRIPLTEEEENSYNDKNLILFLYQYCGASFEIKINYNQIEKNAAMKKGKIDLSEIEYLGGLNCFIPLFKIIKKIINNFEFISNNNNIKEEKEKLELLSGISKYIDKSFEWIKDILKTILKMICLSEGNYKNFKKIIVSLIGSLAEISHSLNELFKYKLISLDKISFLFNDEIFSSLYIIILISPFPFNVKKMYRKIVGINKNLDNLIISLDSVFDIEKSSIKNLNWYFTILVIYIEFIFIYFNSFKKVPYRLINLIIFFLPKNNNTEKNITKKEEAIKILTNIMHNFYNKENKDKSEQIMEDKNFLNDNNYYFKLIIYMITTFLNIKLILKINKIELNKGSYYEQFLTFFKDYFKKKDKINITDDYAQMIINFKYYPEEILFLQELFPFLGKENFNSENELIMDELIDYHGIYHHLMKELFIFNRLWSKQKLYFNPTLEKIQKSKLKYKNINYYTRNFQRPIIYPVLDYKHRYPEFSNFKISQDFYNLEEDSDEYNFDLDCPELDKFLEENDKEIFEKIEKNGKINTCEVCLIKQTHHIKGNLFIFYDENKIIIYFYSYSYRLQNNEEENLCCNKESEEENKKKDNIKNNLCYGSIFKCPKKDANKKIKIELDDIRLVLSRIYFYRNSALEIFTESKSYYFNFVSENKKDSLICTFMYPCEEYFFPINVDGNVIGYMNLNKKIINKNKFSNLINKNNNFIDFFCDKTSKGELCEMCIFDIIMIINLISNRSFNDLYQYPIFPVLYLYDKQNHEIINRDFKEHIGFQENSEKSKARKTLILQSYEETINEFNEKGNENENNQSLYYFNTHYSNSIYTSNYLIRLFPYSFLAIELQGNGFDNPNRLFFSIEETLYNISSQKSDLRELIPEFFYLPEMFMNINSINFHKRTNNELVDDVSVPRNLPNKNESLSNFEYKEEIINDFSVLFIENYNKKENIKNCFIFIEEMKNKLENLTKDLSLWLNLIFGINQKISPKNQIYFRPESYINFNDKYTNYLKDSIIMNSFEFGIIPLQTIFDNKILNNLQKRKSNEYEKYEQDIISKIKIKNFKKTGKKINKIFNIYQGCFDNEEYKEKNDKKNEKEENKYFNNEFNDYWDEQLNIDFEINNIDNFGKIELYKNGILINEIIDHNDIIIDFFYNRRLNMFATTSFDGFICIYILPNKLFSMIKHPKNSFYDKIFLSANPFPTIIAYENEDNILTSFSLSGLLIKRVKIEVKNEDKINEIKMEPVFNIYGGAFKDKLKIVINYDKRIVNEFYNVPFFDIEHKEIFNK